MRAQVSILSLQFLCCLPKGVGQHQQIGACNRIADDRTGVGSYRQKAPIDVFIITQKRNSCSIARLDQDPAVDRFGVRRWWPGEEATVTGLALSGDRVTVAKSYIETIRSELGMAWRFTEGHGAEPPLYGRETYWGTIRYISRFSKRQARELMHIFENVDWDKLLPLDLPGKRGKVEFSITSKGPNIGKKN